MNAKNLPGSTFVTVDVEWATRDHQICQIGLAVARNNEIAIRGQWLIQPPGNEYDETLFSNHKVRPEMTETAPTLEEVWPEIQPHLLTGELWAHNAASAEIPAFQKSLAEYNMSADWLSINDSIELFQRDDCKGGNGLAQCAMAMGVPFDETMHHDALYDAETLAEILIRYAQGFRPKWGGVPVSSEQLRKSQQEKLILKMGEFAAHEKKQKDGELAGDIDLFAELTSTYAGAHSQVVDVFDKGDQQMGKDGNGMVDYSRVDTGQGNPLRDKVVAITGNFKIPRREIDRFLKAVGAKSDGMTGKTDVMLVGTWHVGLPKLAKYEKQRAKRAVALVVGDEDLEAFLYGEVGKFFAVAEL